MRDKLIRCITRLSDTDTVQSETLCDKLIRCITHLSDTDTVQSEKLHDKLIRCITRLGDSDISFALFKISYNFLLFLECCLISPKLDRTKDTIVSPI